MGAVERGERELAARTTPSCLLAADDAEQRWQQLSVPERRVALAEVLDCVFVQRGHGRPCERVHVCWAGEAPGDLPRGGVRGRDHVSFSPPGGWPTVAGVRGRRWSIARVERELRSFLTGATSFPLPGELEAAGAGELLAQIERRGGGRVWAARMGVAYPAHRHGEPWTEARIRAALEVYLEGASRWPGPRAFGEDGLGGLTAAISRTGGVARWSREFRVARRMAGRDAVVPP